MDQNQSLNIRMMVFATLFTVLIIIGGYISFPIPLSPLPIVLSDFFAMLAGLFLGKKWGSASVGLFLFLGALGLPTFAGGKAGLVVLFGPTGGFLLGFLVSAFVVGLISGKGKPSLLKDFLALFLGNIFLYSVGVSWLKFILKLTWREGIALGFLPFIPGIIIKVVVSIILINTMRPHLKQIIPHSLQGLGGADEHS